MSSDARAVLRRAGLTPKKGFGQNFLVDGNALAGIARACVPDDEIGRAVVVELGAGLGALTLELGRRAARVHAVERDRELVPLLREVVREAGLEDRVVVEEGDAQTFALPEGCVLAGNLPYQITGRLLERAVHHADSLQRAVFMIQREVALRLEAEPSTKDYGGLTVFTRAAFDVRRMRDVGPSSFFPPPEVHSSVVLLQPVRPRRAQETETFRALVRGAFGMRRKTLRNAWARCAPAPVLADAATRAGVSLDARGETLTVDDYARMARELETGA